MPPLRRSKGGDSKVNIESDEKLLRKYKHDIPVVMIDGVEAFRHRVNVEKFKTRVISG
jgi:hypothetical protein